MGARMKTCRRHGHAQRRPGGTHVDSAALRAQNRGRAGGSGAHLFWRVVIEVDRELVELLCGEADGLAVGLDDDLRVHPLLDERLGLAQELTRQQHDRGGAIAHLRVLRHGDLHQRVRRRVHDLELLHQGGAVVGDGDAAILVRCRAGEKSASVPASFAAAEGPATPPRRTRSLGALRMRPPNADGASLVCARRAPLALLTESGADDVDDRLAGIDVGDELRLALRGVGALAEQHNLRLHAQPAHAGHHAHATGHMGCAREGREWVAMARRDSGAVVAGFLAVKSAVASSPHLKQAKSAQEEELRPVPHAARARAHARYCIASYSAIYIVHSLSIVLIGVRGPLCWRHSPIRVWKEGELGGRPAGMFRLPSTFGLPSRRTPHPPS
eukprot:scaffold8069_cov126-Isochrysis_galbana.AAC.13